MKRYDVVSDYIHYNFLYNNLLENEGDQILLKKNKYKSVLERLVYQNYYSIYASLSSFVNMSMNNDIYNIFRHHYYLNKENFYFLFNNDLIKNYDKLWLKLKWSDEFYFDFDETFEDFRYYFHDYLSLYFKYVKSHIGFYEKFFFISNNNSLDKTPNVVDFNYYDMTSVNYKFDLNLDYKYKMKTVRLKYIDNKLDFFERFSYNNSFVFSFSDLNYLLKFNNVLSNLIYKLNLNEFHIVDRYLWNARMAFVWTVLEDEDDSSDDLGDNFWFHLVPRFWHDNVFLPYTGRRKKADYLSYLLRTFLFDFKRYSFKLLMLDDAFRDFLFALILFFCHGKLGVRVKKLKILCWIICLYFVVNA